MLRDTSWRWSGAIIVCALLLVPLTLAGQQQSAKDGPGPKPPRLLTEEDKDQLATGRKLAAETVALYNKGQFAAAEAVARQGLDIHLKVWGEDHPDTASSYFNLAATLRNQGKLKDAAQMDGKALEIRRKVLGEEHLETAGSYYTLAVDLFNLTQFAAAEQMDRKALEIRLKLLGEQHAQTAQAYNNLAADLREQGKFTAAEQMDRKALEICRKVHGEVHIQTAGSYNNLAADLIGLGQYAVAEQMDRSALAIRRKVGGEESPGAIQSYNNLAGALLMQGQYAAAEQLHRKVLEISRRLTGDDSIGTAQCRHNLAGDLMEQGQHAAAEQLNRKSYEVFRKLLGEAHPETARSLNSLATNLAALNQHAAAEQLQRKVVDIYRATLGEGHPSTARGITTLANAMIGQGRYGPAAEQLHKASEILVKALGEDHPATAASFSNEAVALSQQAQFAAAEKLYRKALDVERKVLGENHPDTALGYQLLAFCLYSQGDYGAAEQLGLAAARSYQAARLRVSFTGLGRALFGVRQSPLRPLAVVLARNNKPDLAWKYLEEDLGRGLLDDLTSRNTRKLTAEERQHEQALLGKLANIERYLSADKKIDAKELAGLQLQRDQLMGSLLELQEELEKKYSVAAGQMYAIDRIQAALPADAALVAWVDVLAGPAAKDPSGDHWAVVVRRQGKPAWVQLKGTGPQGSWQDKDYELPDKLREVLQNPDPNTDWKSWRDDMGKLRLRPLAEHLEGVSQLVVLPSASMAGIPLEVLSDRYKVSYAPSGSMYAWLQEHRKDFAKGTNTLLALADPTFSKEQAELALIGKHATRLLVRGALKPLPGTRGEANAIAKLFGKDSVQLLAGAEANTVNLDRLAENNKLAKFRFLHLATHGFADPKGGLNSYLALSPESLVQASHDKLSAAHMLRTWRLEADVVTLSACTTALGEYQGGEGYVGFSQALFLAGAHTVVLSQWPVHDLSTTLLMERFYQNMLGARSDLKTPLGKAEALAEARRWLKGLTRSQALDKLKGLGIAANEAELAGQQPFEHPFYWAPFILVGDPGKSGS